MSIGSSLANALTGLSAAARAAEVVSSNVSNALTEGYGRREVLLSAQSVGGQGAGVQVVGISRSVDPQVLTERRASDAAVQLASQQSDYFASIEAAIGTPDDEGSLNGRIAKFEATLIEAASAPQSDTRLTAVVEAGRDITEQLNDLTSHVQSMRMEADREIGRQVDLLNTNLKQVEELNIEIQQQLTSGRDAAALMDQRQVLIDQISQIIPVREIPRQNEMVSLYTPGGAILLDTQAAEIGFTSVGIIIPDMTLELGSLSGLTINGQPSSMTNSRNPLGGGSLEGLFQIRDQLATTTQEQLDGVARDLIERFADPAVDPTLAPTDAGLFTDSGLALDLSDPLNEIGLAGRIDITTIVDPSRGGDLWKLRDGLNAITPGDQGNATLINGLADALTATRVAASGGFSPTARSASGLAADFLSVVKSNLVFAEADQSFATAQYDTLKTIELQDGVDTDYEMQRLLLIEQAYSANARVITTVDEMINTILGI